MIYAICITALLVVVVYATLIIFIGQQHLAQLKVNANLQNLAGQYNDLLERRVQARVAVVNSYRSSGSPPPPTAPTPPNVQQTSALDDLAEIERDLNRRRGNGPPVRESFEFATAATEEI